MNFSKVLFFMQLFYLFGCHGTSSKREIVLPDKLFITNRLDSLCLNEYVSDADYWVVFFNADCNKCLSDMSIYNSYFKDKVNNDLKVFFLLFSNTGYAYLEKDELPFFDIPIVLDDYNYFIISNNLNINFSDEAIYVKNGRFNKIINVNDLLP